MKKGLISRAAGIAALAFLLVVGSFLVVMPESAEAALGLTSMNVTDGDTVAAPGQTDWLSPPPNLSVIDDYEYTGTPGAVITDPSLVPTLCDAKANDLTTLKGQIADNPLQFTSAPPPPADKANLCQTYTAYEVVGGQVIFYFGGTKVSPNGDTSVFVVLNQNTIVPNTVYRTAGDVLLEFNYGGQSLTEVRAWTWTGSVWSPASSSTAFGGSASANNLFFEAAVNLTAFGIFPPPTSPDQCLDLANILAIGKVGNGLPASLKDTTGPGDISISNCATLIVEKDTTPAEGTGPFTFGVTAGAFGGWSGSGSLASDGSSQSFDLLPGTYTVVEDDPFGVGWNFAGYSCSSGDDGDSRTAGVSVDLALGDVVTCTIENVQPAISVTKTADPTSLPEPGGDVTFTFTVTNTGPEDVTLTSLVDDTFGNLNGQGDCVVPQLLASPGGAYTCSITKGLLSGNFADHLNTVTATAEDDAGLSAVATDNAIVTFDNLPSSILVTKTPRKTTVPEPGAPVIFDVTVENTSAVDTVTIDSLIDDRFGDLAGQGNCGALIGADLAPNASLACFFQRMVSGDAGFIHTNVVTANGTDDDGFPVSDDDDATVTVTDVLPTVELAKSAVPSLLPEPGGDFVFTLTVTNTSVEPVTITDLSDSQSGATDFSACSALEGSVLAVGETVECEYTVAHTDAGSYDNTASVTVEDNDGNSASAEAAETVTVVDVLPSVDLVKDASPGSLPEPGGEFAFTLTIYNTTIEPVQVTALSDDYTLPVDCTSLVGQWIPVGGSLSCSYTVTHTEAGSYDNTASVTVEDNEGNPASDTDDETVTVTDTPIAISLQKTADPLFLNEPGGSFTYTLIITNPSQEAVEITALTDTNALSADCLNLIGVTLSPAGDEGDSVSCTYTVDHTAPGIYPNLATVTVMDNEENEATDDDDASVSVIDVPSSILVTKTPAVTQIAEPGGTVTFTVVVENTSAVDMLIVASLVDDVYGDLNGLGDCEVPQKLAVGESYTCSFEGDVLGNAGDVHTNVVTVVAEDDDGVFIEDDDDATVTVTDKPTGTIGDFVWNDTDEDGIQDANEVGVEGVLVELVDADTGEVIASTTTGADGAYEFSGVEEGDYILRFTTPKSWEFGLVDQGDDDSVDSDAVFQSGSGEDAEHFEIAETLPFSLAAGETNTSFDAGMIKIFVSPQVITTTTTTTTVATTTISTLPFTGFGQGDVAGTALVLIVLGGFVLLAMRRREDLLETVVAEAVHPAWDE